MLIYLMLVAGGVLGGALRFVLSSVFPYHGVLPWCLLWVNLSGALVLGALYGFSEIAFVKPWVRVGVGAGFIGSFTTFSSSCLQIDAFATMHFWISCVYLVGTVVGGPILALAGKRTVITLAVRGRVATGGLSL